MAPEGAGGKISEDVLEEIILQWKEKGNTQLKAGDASAAAESYGQGIDVAAPGVLRGQLYSNRAQAWLLLGKDEAAVGDSKLAIQDDPKNAKAYWRGATAAMRLQKYEEAKDLCSSGLAALGSNSALQSLLSQAEKQLSVRRGGAEAAEPDCGICLGPLGRAETVTLSCKHTFHRECASELRSHGAAELCPRCRAVACRAQGGGSAGLLDEALTLYVRSCAGSPGKAPASGAAAREAAKLLRDILAEEPDCGPAARVLGCLFAVGAGVELDLARAKELWEQAAGLGDEGAQFYLGQHLDSQAGSPQDRVRALELWERAAASDHAAAQFCLGRRLERGDGVVADKARALALWERAAAHGHPAALFSLGAKYERGDGVPRDEGKALELCARAARHGHAGAQFGLGARYNKGEGVQQDPAKAAELWALAAEQGHGAAQFNLGIKYYAGDGVEEDLERAEGLWEKAAEQGHADAAHNLSMLRG